jgi:Fe-S-cluster-containing dehydrogenase component
MERSPVSRDNAFDDTYQTMPSTEWNYWNLIKFAEDERDGNLMWLMRKTSACTAKIRLLATRVPADGAIVKYENGIVDFQQENCIGCGYCISAARFDIRNSTKDEESLQVHALLRSGGPGTRACMHQGLPDGMSTLRDQIRHGSDRWPARETAARTVGLC